MTNGNNPFTIARCCHFVLEKGEFQSVSCIAFEGKDITWVAVDVFLRSAKDPLLIIAAGSWKGNLRSNCRSFKALLQTPPFGRTYLMHK